MIEKRKKLIRAKLETRRNTTVVVLAFSIYSKVELRFLDRIPEYPPGLKTTNLLLSCALRLVWVDAACIFVLGGGSVAEENLDT